VRDALELCGFTPFVKTTGGKGIHVVAAIKGTPKKPALWSDAKEFAHALVDRLAEAAPERYTTNMSKKKRGGKIFLDYLRNDRMATAVGPWSPRAREGATIATPIAWKELRKGFDPSAFTIETAAPLLKRADPWADLAASAISLDGARKKLERL
jgi:bifunctional non-homologous end joining protein LigD